MAPTDSKVGALQGTAESFFISGFGSNNSIHLVNENGTKAFTSKIYESEGKYGSKDTFALIKLK